MSTGSREEVVEDIANQAESTFDQWRGSVIFVLFAGAMVILMFPGKRSLGWLLAKCLCWNLDADDHDPSRQSVVRLLSIVPSMQSVLASVCVFAAANLLDESTDADDRQVFLNVARVVLALSLMRCIGDVAEAVTQNYRSIVHERENPTIYLLSDGFKVAFGTMTFIYCLYAFGLQVYEIFVAVGVAVFVLTFGLQHMVQNFAGFMVVAVYRPFKVGDQITLEGVTGIVQYLGLFYIHLSTPEKTVMILNSTVLEANVEKSLVPVGEIEQTLNFQVEAPEDMTKCIDLRESLLQFIGVQAVSEWFDVKVDAAGPAIAFECTWYFKPKIVEDSPRARAAAAGQKKKPAESPKNTAAKRAVALDVRVDKLAKLYKEETMNEPAPRRGVFKLEHQQVASDVKALIVLQLYAEAKRLGLTIVPPPDQ